MDRRTEMLLIGVIAVNLIVGHILIFKGMYSASICQLLVANLFAMLMIWLELRPKPQSFIKKESVNISTWEEEPGLWRGIRHDTRKRYEGATEQEVLDEIREEL